MLRLYGQALVERLAHSSQAAWLWAIPLSAERPVGEHKFAGVAAASESFLPLVVRQTTAFFFASVGRGLTYASDVIAARRFITI
jgi:hypothetical protein